MQSEEQLVEASAVTEVPRVSLMTRLWVIAVLTVGVVVACDRVPLTSPTGSTITLSVDRDTLPINGQATLTAVVTEVSGTPVHNGTTVTFQTSLGRTDPIEAETVNGKATVTFLAGTVSGIAQVNAFSGGARTGTTSGNSSSGGAVSIKVGTAGVDRIGVRTEPTNIPVSGGTVVVIASFFDLSGNAIANTPVSFSTDFGTLSSSTATTDANGEARVNLTTNRTTTVTASAGSGKSQTFTLAALNPPTITISCTGSGNATPQVGVPVNCTVKPVSAPSGAGNASSTAPIQNVTVTWGDNTGEQPLGAIANGTDSTVQHTYTATGTYSVTAAAIDANSQRGTTTISVVVIRSTPSGFTLTCPTNASAGVPGTFKFTPATNPAIPVSNVTVEFGDGTSRNLGSPVSELSFAKAYGSEGGYTATATVTDITGQRGSTSCTTIVGRTAAPTITLTQTGNISGGCGVFSITASASTGVSLTSFSVRQNDQTDAFFTGSSAASGTVFSRCGLTTTSILVGTATDSLGQTATTTLLVK